MTNLSQARSKAGRKGSAGFKAYCHPFFKRDLPDNVQLIKPAPRAKEPKKDKQKAAAAAASTPTNGAPKSAKRSHHKVAQSAQVRVCAYVHPHTSCYAYYITSPNLSSSSWPIDTCGPHCLKLRYHMLGC